MDQDTMRPGDQSGPECQQGDQHQDHVHLSRHHQGELQHNWHLRQTTATPLEARQKSSESSRVSCSAKSWLLKSSRVPGLRTGREVGVLNQELSITQESLPGSHAPGCEGEERLRRANEQPLLLHLGQDVRAQEAGQTQLSTNQEAEHQLHQQQQQIRVQLYGALVHHSHQQVEGAHKDRKVTGRISSLEFDDDVFRADEAPVGGEEGLTVHHLFYTEDRGNL
ncbi:hypothetical protein EYF80_024509 [Liparis tanakae]|uniref:Uncharacterized protein n=1 Tax=Liparis tanakae TaxID=230148 RepID=A0A4Z2HI67_9TELE|nr:hypothetical protein EYF80_024509 [Liparis tanakae]